MFQKAIDCLKAHQASQDVSDNGFIEALVINAKCGALKDAFGAALSDVDEADHEALNVHLPEQVVETERKNRNLVENY